MKLHKIIKTKSPQDVDVGSIIIAQPFWQDESYRRSVIFLLSHDNEGSTGILLNKKTTIFVNEALAEITEHLPLYYGGPLDTSTISFIHAYPQVPNAIDMGNELFWSGDFEFIEEMSRNGQVDWKKIKFFAGFVKWSHGQLESEISENKWWTSELTSNELFNTTAEELWSRELLNNGHIYGMLEEFPDPSMN